MDRATNVVILEVWRAINRVGAREKANSESVKRTGSAETPPAKVVRLTADREETGAVLLLHTGVAFGKQPHAASRIEAGRAIGGNGSSPHTSRRGDTGT